MNDNFDFNRFGKLIAYECNAYVPRFIKVLVISLCVVFALWVTTVVFNSTITFTFRASLLNTLFGISCFVGPFVTYKYMNDRKRGYAYAMLPASTLEKFISMLVICVLVLPMTSYLTLVAADAFFWFVSLCGIGGFTDLGVFNPLVVDIERTISIYYLSPHILTVTLSMMFNAIFRKAKIIKTILVNMAFYFISVILIYILVMNLSNDTMRDIAQFMENLGVNGCINIVVMPLIAVSLFVTYRRIERVNY